tara:strand:+ start:3890 stop:4381 length:492 start_codon:yes stop_codon:yes gene_type:complete
MQPPLHQVCLPLAPLLGVWQGTGSGHYPTIDNFEYSEEVVYAHMGKPFVTYAQKTKNASDGQPLHSEQGFLRVVDATTLEMVIAQPTGIVETHIGSYVSNEESFIVKFDSIEVSTTPSAKSVEQVSRLVRVAQNELTYDVSMAAAGQSFQHHLEAKLQRVQPD